MRSLVKMKLQLPLTQGRPQVASTEKTPPTYFTVNNIYLEKKQSIEHDQSKKLLFSPLRIKAPVFVC